MPQKRDQPPTNITNQSANVLCNDNMFQPKRDWSNHPPINTGYDPTPSDGNPAGSKENPSRRPPKFPSPT